MNDVYDGNTYSAILTRIVDADTLDLEIDLGFYIITRQRIRLIGLDCPEIKTEDGIRARDFVIHWFASNCGKVNGGAVRVCTRKTEKFGRWLGEILSTDGVSLNDDLLKHGHAKPMKP